MEQAIKAARKIMNEYAPQAESIAERNLTRVLEAFRAERVSTQCFAPTSGYGYNDLGRDKLEQLYARVFHAEAALVRQQIVSGSHAIALALAGNLLPGDELLLLGRPYDTLQTVIGMNHPVAGSLSEYGVTWRVHELDFLTPDLAALAADLRPETKMVLIQRSRGYSLRRSLPVDLIGQICAAIKSARPEIIVFVDNCYGEMVEEKEPSEVGADLMAGSLIKNPGAGIAPGGGYIVGKASYVERAAARLTIPGAGRELGASLIDNRLFYQSLWLAPQIVLEAVLGAVFTAAFMEQLGFSVDPGPAERRTDIVQTVAMGNAARLQAFVRGIQQYSPVDSFVAPEPWPMPGYDNDIIMASGSFIAGSSIELSADAPLREPYSVFIQGGLSRYHVIYAVTRTLAEMRASGLL
jgi:cystathionine beta-lyase family protein involved in aluminum resistance